MNDKIAKELDIAFRLISTIFVRENDVDAMAMAKQHLRNAYAMLTAPEVNEDVKGVPTNGG